MEYIPTNIEPRHIKKDVIEVEKHVNVESFPTDIVGLSCVYKMSTDDLNTQDYPWYPTGGCGNGHREFTVDDQKVVKTYLDLMISLKEKINILEIGVHRNTFDESSTSVFLNNKRKGDVYVGIDIADKSFLDNMETNVHTICTDSTNVDQNVQIIKDLGINEIDILMIDGYHSIDTVYSDWKYTSILSKDGIILMHDTNVHPGPYFLMKSIDYDKYHVKKYFYDIRDWGIGVAIRK